MSNILKNMEKCEENTLKCDENVSKSMKTGEEKDLTVSFPEDYGVEDLKGQPVIFKG